MAIVGWYCSTCKKDVEFRHFMDQCRDPLIPGEFEAVLLREMEKPVETHTGFNVSSSSLTSCPRSLLIERFVPVHVDPRHFHSTEMGSSVHRAIAQAAVAYKLGNAEVPIRRAIIPGLECCGEVSCVIDFITKDRRTCKDWKVSNATALRYVPPHTAKPEHNIQLSINRLAANASDPAYQIEFGVVWYTGVLGMKEQDALGGLPWLRRPVIFRTAEEILDFHPFDGDWEVRQIVSVLRSSFKRLKDGEEPQSVIKSLPLYGLSMMREKKSGESLKCKKFCAMAPYCADIGSDCESAPPWFAKLKRSTGPDDDISEFLGFLE